MRQSSEPDPSPRFTASELVRLDSALQRVVAAQKARAAVDAEEAAALADAMGLALERREALMTAASRRADLPLREIAAELGAATRTSDRAIQVHMDDAFTLVTKFTATLQTLATGGITRAHVTVIVETGARIDDDAARAVFEDAALEVCRRETPGRCRPILKMLAQRIDPITLQERHDKAKADTDVWVRDVDDAISHLIIAMPTVNAHGALDRIKQYARGIIAARSDGAPDGDTLDGDTLDGTAPETFVPDTRPIGQVRADVAADLLLTGHATLDGIDASVPETHAIIAQVQITIPVETLTGGSDEAGELTGSGPIPADQARCLAATAKTWTRLLTDAFTCVLSVDQYTPSWKMRRLLAARDEHCRFPGCRQPVWRCDVDHTIPYADGGETHVCNLAHLCKRHHILKHNSAWKVQQLPGGVLEWTSPTGRVYPDIPARTLAFTSAGGAPPGRDTGEPPPF